MASVSIVDDINGIAGSDVEALPRPRDPLKAAHIHRSSCCRCREAIVQDAHETWVTAAEGDPWCQAGAHLPKSVPLGEG